MSAYANVATTLTNGRHLETFSASVPQTGATTLQGLGMTAASDTKNLVHLQPHDGTLIVIFDGSPPTDTHGYQVPLGGVLAIPGAPIDDIQMKGVGAAVNVTAFTWRC